jgi:hypothetical protein
MPLSSPRLQRFARRALLEAAGAGDPDIPGLSFAFNDLCERLRRRLQPLFGKAAIAALFGRALHVATSDFGWLTQGIGTTGDCCSADALTTVQGVETDRLTEGLATVLAHTIGLLSAFIGEDLVMPLVQEAWGMKMLAEDQRGPKVINE